MEPSAQPPAASPAPASRARNALRFLHPSHTHTAFAATLLLMAAAAASRVIGLVRIKYVAWLLGAGSAADAYNSAFMLPDKLQYFLIGGASSIVFVTMLSRYHDQGRWEEGQRAMAVILSTMGLVLGVAIVAAEFLAPLYVHTFLPGFSKDPATANLCIRLTRILLPAQLFFLAGGVFSAVLLARKQFALQAVTPLIYNIGIILGGVFLAHELGASSLAIGAVAGALIGPFLLNAIWAHRAGMRFRFILDFHNPGLREWVGLSVPLMLGVSLVSADNWIIYYFASHNGGAVTLLNYAKQFFNAPVALGQAAGAASLPFLASLFTRRDVAAFSNAVNTAVSRILAFSLLLSAFMLAMGYPLLDLILRGGAFHRADSHRMAVYFSIFSVSLCLWAAQAIYARAFYAAGNTVLPMIASTLVTAVTIPIYWWLYHTYGPIGLPFASDIGILLQTVTLAILLHKKRMVSIAQLEYPELARSLAAGFVAFCVLFALRHLISGRTRLVEFALLVLATLLWIAVSTAVLKATGSRLPSQLLRRLRKSPA